jgi:hypothetical protein
MVDRDSKGKCQELYNRSRLVAPIDRDWVYQDGNQGQEDTEVDTVVDRGWVYQGKNLSQENTEVDNNKTRPAECPPGKVERASWGVLGDDWARDA